MIPAQLPASKRWCSESSRGGWFIRRGDGSGEVAPGFFRGCRVFIRETREETARKTREEKCTHPGHHNCHGVYNCCTLLCSLYGCLFSLLARNPPPVAGHSAVGSSETSLGAGRDEKLVCVFTERGLNRERERKREKERERPSGRKWPSALFSREIGLRFSRCLAVQGVPRETSSRNEFLRGSRWKLSSSIAPRAGHLLAERNPPR